MNLPRNAAAILDARMHGLKPEQSVIVSFVGQTDFDGPHVHCESGARYDWRFLKGLHAIIAIKPGIDADHAMRSIFDQADLLHAYPTVLDMERQQMACLIDNRPLRLWQVKRDTQLWREHFA